MIKSLFNLRRITSGSNWIPEIDGLRFVAIMSVVLFHLFGEITTRSHVRVEVQDRYSTLATLIHHGDRGVSVFFVISGFILGLPFARHYLQGGKKVSLKNYFLRRVTRLEPPYIFALVVTAAVIHFYKPETFDNVVASVVESIFYSYNIIHGAIFGVSWSLEVEIQFYVLVPLLTMAYLIKHHGYRRALFLLAILLIGVFQYFTIYPARTFATGRAFISIAYYLQYFLTGLLFSDLYLLEMPKWRRSWLWDLVSLIAWPAIFFLDASWWHAALPFLILPAFLAAFRSHAANRFFSTTWVAVIGGMCYSIYLWHFFLIGILMKATRHLLVFNDFLLNYCVQVMVMVPIILLFSTIIFTLIERPCMDPKWPVKFWSALKAIFFKAPPAVEPVINS